MRKKQEISSTFWDKRDSRELFPICSLQRKFLLKKVVSHSLVTCVKGQDVHNYGLLCDQQSQQSYHVP